MKLILASDIWGKTPAFEALATCFSHLGDISLVSPYPDKDISFKNEQDAYLYFSEHIGVENYSAMIAANIDCSAEPVFLIGFSVGASAIWHLSAQDNQTKVVGALGVYSGQIRHWLDISPTFPVSLIFPEAEAHFNVNAVLQHLSKIPHVNCSQVPFCHGYLNEYSPNFNQFGYRQFTQAISKLTPTHLSSAAGIQAEKLFAY